MVTLEQGETDSLRLALVASRQAVPRLLAMPFLVFGMQIARGGIEARMTCGFRQITQFDSGLSLVSQGRMAQPMGRGLPQPDNRQRVSSLLLHDIGRLGKGLTNQTIQLVRSQRRFSIQAPQHGAIAVTW